MTIVTSFDLHLCKATSRRRFSAGTAKIQPPSAQLCLFLIPIIQTNACCFVRMRCWECSPPWVGPGSLLQQLGGSALVLFATSSMTGSRGFGTASSDATRLVRFQRLSSGRNSLLNSAARSAALILGRRVPGRGYPPRPNDSHLSPRRVTRITASLYSSAQQPSAPPWAIGRVNADGSAFFSQNCLPEPVLRTKFLDHVRV